VSKEENEERGWHLGTYCTTVHDSYQTVTIEFDYHTDIRFTFSLYESQHTLEILLTRDFSLSCISQNPSIASWHTESSSVSRLRNSDASSA
jgi:hypothetical protein